MTTELSTSARLLNTNMKRPSLRDIDLSDLGTPDEREQGKELQRHPAKGSEGQNHD